MPEHPQYDEHDIFNPETHHEESDVNVRALIWFFVIFIVGSIVTYLAIFGMYRGLVSFESKRKGPALTSMPQSGELSIPRNEPRLQPFPRKVGDAVLAPYATTPVTDMNEMRRAEDRILNHYGWVDQQKGVVHIPIEEAKKLVLQRGLAVQSGQPVANQVAQTPDRLKPAATPEPAAALEPATALEQAATPAVGGGVRP